MSEEVSGKLHSFSPYHNQVRPPFVNSKCLQTNKTFSIHLISAGTNNIKNKYRGTQRRGLPAKPVTTLQQRGRQSHLQQALKKKSHDNDNAISISHQDGHFNAASTSLTKFFKFIL
jgi:hypothetical protein